MKKTCRFARYIVLLLGIACFSSMAHAAPYGPKGREINWVQPTGEKLKLRVYGDEFYARTETEEGYTVVYNPANGAYHYAEIGAKGTAMKPSSVKAHLPPRAGVPKHLELSVENARKIQQANRARLSGDNDKRWAARVQAVRQMKAAQASGIKLSGPQAAAIQAAAAPVIGRKVGLTILAQFPNDPQTGGRDPIDFPTSRGEIEDFCNQVGYSKSGNTGSVRDFYADQSLGKVTYVQDVTQIVTLPKARNFYNYEDYPTNNVLRDTGEAGNMLINDAVAVLKGEGFDFSGLTVDADNNAIATNLFFAGPDSGVWAGGLWPHQWNLQTRNNVGTASAPIYLNAYQVTNIENSSPVIGTFVHENGHLLLGYPDLYSYVGQGEGVGNHCVMAGGSYNNDGKTPCPINAYFKDLVGWATITELAPVDFVSKTLPTTGNIACRINKPGSTTESFVVENRGNGDKWAEFNDDKGIVIWHIDESIDGNGNRTGTDPHYGVSLEQADGAFDLEGGRNRGDSSDLFDLGTPLFTDGTTPNANWWNGSASDIRVKILSGAAANTKVQFGKLPADTIIVDAPNGGEVMYRDSVFTIRWEANIVGNVKIDLYRRGVFLRVIENNVPNTGSYAWEVSESIDAGEDYTIRVSSISNPNPVFDSSNATFSVTDSTFPMGNVMPYGWKKPSDAAVGWEVTKSQVYEGTHSLTSKPVGDGKTAAISYTSNFKEGTVSFYMKVSSEVGYDYASFMIDGVRQSLPTASSKKGITGRQPWSFASFKLGAGKHTLTWTYEKDDSFGEGKDAAWLDGVLLPETTQEIAVEGKQGLRLVSGSNMTRFPAVRSGKKSEPVTFTIKNNGKADLFGLELVAKGSDPDAFLLGALGKTALKSGQSTTFDVTFAPTRPGSRAAEIRIKSNDENESPFIIGVEGRALGIPEIAVFQPEDEKLKNNRGAVNFGYETVGQEGKTKTFTVRNTGSAVVTGLDVSKDGKNKGDFSIWAIGSSKLAPGESTTFKVTFTPGKRNERTALIKIKFDYKDSQTFKINLKGNGAPKNLSKSAIASTDSSALFDAVFGGGESIVSAPVVSTEAIGGSDYLTLTIAKPMAGDGTVEVSPNLVDWYSGVKHTTIVSDNEAFRKVRDNTPVTPGVKRYIRLKATRP